MKFKKLIPILQKYDRTIIPFSGGKDSLACILWALENQLPNIELWHHLVDGREGSDLSLIVPKHFPLKPPFQPRKIDGQP